MDKMIERKRSDLEMQQQQLKKQQQDLNDLENLRDLQTAPPTPVPETHHPPTPSSCISAAPGMSQTIQDESYYSYSDTPSPCTDTDDEALPAAAPDDARSMTASAKADAVSASGSTSSSEDSNEGSESEEVLEDI